MNIKENMEGKNLYGPTKSLILKSGSNNMDINASDEYVSDTFSK